MTPATLWLIAGGALLALEAFGIPGMGFLFAGIAAILTGVLVEANVVSEHAVVGQFAWFFGITCVTAALLWKKLKAWRTRTPKGGEYQNIVGGIGIVAKGGLKKGAVGQVAWSGTTMQAELANYSDVDHLTEGAQVEISATEGNKLIVIPRKT